MGIPTPNISELALFFLSIAAGGFGGVATGLGFWPRYSQPKNIRIQMILSGIALALLFLVLYLS
jgi:hypothetical protein